MDPIEYANSEVFVDSGLVLAENVPQLVIQIVYFAITTADNNTSVAFYVTIMVSQTNKMLNSLSDFVKDYHYAHACSIS